AADPHLPAAFVADPGVRDDASAALQAVLRLAGASARRHFAVATERPPETEASSPPY
ncbi:MAG: hypothetical protein JST59_07010, partial [Actinobacteria bacterium]|nr:hypothetical protein [Actinomycetota bacterium]